MMRQLFHLYLRHVVARLGLLFSGKRNAYRYLAESARRFYTSAEVSQMLFAAGFRQVCYRPLLWGVAGIHVAVKQRITLDRGAKAAEKQVSSNLTLRPESLPIVARQEAKQVIAAVLHKPGDVRVQAVADPRPGAEEALIRIRACGVCGTDNSLYKGDYPGAYPVVIGHELAGEVLEVGSAVKGLAAGQRVTVDPNQVCHACPYCRAGLEHLCGNVSSMGVHRDGADAEYCVMPAANAYPLPEHLSFEEAADRKSVV